ncbi:MAG: hypothetical protein FWH53_00130 [Leptospirales bacterium]|nr:hypothetical protein [Leptospirales bacterium]
MLNLDNIKEIWPASAFNIDDEIKDGVDKTAYDRFIESEMLNVKRRLVKWLGSNVIEDALSDTPLDEDRATDINKAFASIINAQMVKHLMGMAAMGIEKDISLPSGMKISLSLYTREDFEKTIKDLTDEAYGTVEEYL